MIFKTFIKQIGVFGVALGMSASPLVFAQETEHDGHEQYDPATEQQDPAGTGTQGGTGTGGTGAEGGTGAGGMGAEGGAGAGGTGTEGGAGGMGAEGGVGVDGTGTQGGATTDDEAGFGAGAEGMPEDDPSPTYEEEEGTGNR